MAPTFRHGKGACFLFNNADFSGWFNEATISQSLEPAEVTAFQNSDKAYIPGVRDGTASFSGMFEGTTGAATRQLDSALGASTATMVTVGLEGSTTGRFVKMFASHASGREIGAPTNDKVTASVALQVTGRLDSGHILQSPFAAKTSTGSESSVDSGLAAGSAYGGVGHLHVLSDSTLTTLAVKIQHSTNGSAWSDLITFTNTTSSTGANARQRVEVTGTVKRYVRATRSTFTGGAGKSITAGVAFGRRIIP